MIGRAVGLGVLAVLITAVPAAAQEAPARSVTAVATASIEVPKETAKNNAAIAAAVLAARQKAGPAAVVNVKAEAQRLATAAGLTLGELVTVAELQPSPFGPFGAYGEEGTFGPGRFCGTIRTPIYHTTKAGRRVFTRKFRKHFGCRIPSRVQMTISATFAAQ